MILKQSPNKWPGRNGQKPEAIVIHIAEGTFKGTKSWINNPKSQVSYHYLVSETGKLARLVKEENSAWHAGVVENPQWVLLKNNINPNLYTIGICLSGFTINPPTILQMTAVAFLIQSIAERYQLPINIHTVIPHKAINEKKECPGHNIDTKLLIDLANLPLT